jgi:uncharacterized protein (DUF488 family)
MSMFLFPYIFDCYKQQDIVWKVYRTLKSANVKERMFLVLSIVYYGKIATHVAKREIHKSKGRAAQWLKRY